MSLEDKEEMKKFEQGFGYKFEVDSDRLMEWILALSSVNAQIKDEKLFTAGFNLSALMEKMINCHIKLQKAENKYEQ